MLSWLAPILVFGLVIFVHELGHFLAAKAVGVYAPRFSIGFGRALWRRRWGETEYRVALIPLGGYVRMASRDDAAMASIEGGSEEGDGNRPGDADYDPEAMVPFGPKPVPPHRWFESKSLAARLFIMIAGVTMNILLALVVAIGLVATLGRTVVETRTVGRVQPMASAPALTREIVPGDTIVAVDGRAVRTWNEITERIAGGTEREVRIRTQRGEVVVPVADPSGREREELLYALEPLVPVVVDSIVRGRPAARAGLAPGDSIVAVAGAPVRTFSELVERVGAAAGREIELRFVRAGAEQSVVVRPESTTVTDPETGTSSVQGRIGLAPRPIVRRERLGPGEAVVAGWDWTWDKAAQVTRVLGGLVTGKIGVSQLRGPITITRASVQAARGGVATLLGLIALISINVAIFNLLPVPILDGGQILLNVAESVKGSAFSPRTREYILRAGLVAIALLLVIVLFNDVVDLGKLFG
ncbi:MAG TPA: RIP metalloprotease RseP [Gemmatimonadaceae bacterium]|nr:RIP metalloprotease RseP [Gemmatimonadaceae bacterium]